MKSFVELVDIALNYYLEMGMRKTAVEMNRYT